MTSPARRPLPTIASLRPAAATLAAVAGPLLGGVALAWHGEALAAWLSEKPVGLAVLIVVVAGAAAAGAALLPTHAVSLAAGWLLGGVLGPVVAWTAVMLALVFGYALGRVLAGRAWVDGLADRLSRGSTLATVQKQLIGESPRQTALLIALLRLSPLAPFAATNVGLAGVGVRWQPLLIGSAVGLAPRIAIVAWLGAGMAELDLSKPQSPILIALGVGATVAALVVIGRVAQTAMRAATRQPQPSA